MIDDSAWMGRMSGLARNGDRETSIFPVEMTTIRIANFVRLAHTLAIYDDIHIVYNNNTHHTLYVIAFADTNNLIITSLNRKPFLPRGSPNLLGESARHRL